MRAHRWHSDLLERMTLEIEGLRPRVLSDAAYRDLVELMRFRHFKRYYFGTAYDWQRLDELLERVKRVDECFTADLAGFIDFLRRLKSGE